MSLNRNRKQKRQQKHHWAFLNFLMVLILFCAGYIMIYGQEIAPHPKPQSSQEQSLSQTPDISNENNPTLQPESQTELQSESKQESEPELQGEQMSEPQSETQDDPLPEPPRDPEPEPSPEPKPTLTDFLKTAMIPKDQVLYVWGGGWNEEDTGGNEETNSLGMPPSWADFFQANATGYFAEDHRFEIHNGLDCSGYVGWTLYNTLNEKRDYVVQARTCDEFLSDLGLGFRKDVQDVTEILPGDIMTDDGHIYIALGQYPDGSILLIHSSPPGVHISGTSGMAYETALNYQNNPWDPYVDDRYLYYDQFRFSDVVLSDPDHLRLMSPDQVLSFLLNP